MRVEFRTQGAGELAAQGSGAPDDAASFQAPVCRTFQGRCLAIVRPTGTSGEISLRAESAGLEAAAVTIMAR
jgi:beta-galactosidase